MPTKEGGPRINQRLTSLLDKAINTLENKEAGLSSKASAPAHPRSDFHFAKILVKRVNYTFRCLFLWFVVRIDKNRFTM